MKRSVKKQFWFSREEADDLKCKAKKTCLTEAALVRLLIKGYEPKERPDERFYLAMEELSKFTESLYALSAKAETNTFSEEINRWHKFQLDIEHRFLRPERKIEKWQ
ncbi:MAG: plasmid mobilization protein [Lachnospiraceae bacterium]